MEKEVSFLSLAEKEIGGLIKVNTDEEAISTALSLNKVIRIGRSLYLDNIPTNVFFNDIAQVNVSEVNKALFEVKNYLGLIGASPHNS